MIDLLPVLETTTKNIRKSMRQWFSGYPAGMPWTIVSDYCIDDKEKKNDVFSFVVIAHHDKTAEIMEYLSAVAPQDIKKVQRVPIGLMQYLTCPEPVTFSVSFVIERKSALLRDYLRIEDMLNFIPDVCDFIESMGINSPASDAVDSMYFKEVTQRLRIFAKDLARKQPNAKLARQIHLASAFAATMFYLVAHSTRAGDMRWISDRDKLIEHNDTVVYDLAYVYFVLMMSSQARSQEVGAQGRLILELPKIWFELPEKAGENRFDALIRLADYLAGTLADLGPDLSYSKPKFGEMLDGVLVDSSTNCVVQMLSDGERIGGRYASIRSL
ncbi:hypothetical protein [Comamonas sp. B21-038]|uniref:hypothetical protein n=1 Tax=Comamonas sp. B21-038 TaxID=2918299 RepID=UPI001EFB352C|nr:hypothetical protein [Comamonas sp. B21-038]ULR91403.1 hypothetical protein MJ205_11455 [Comamonas sp. B21-038]